MATPEEIHQELMHTSEKLAAALHYGAEAQQQLAEAQQTLAAVGEGTESQEMRDTAANVAQAIQDIGMHLGTVVKITEPLNVYSTEKLGTAVVPGLQVPQLQPVEPVDPGQFRLSVSDEAAPSAKAALGPEGQAAHVQDQVDQLPDRHFNPEEAYITTNDQNLGATMDAAYDQAPATAEDATRVGIIVGNGAFISNAPELADPDKGNLDMVVLVDQNAFMHDWSDYTKETLAASQTPQEYRDAIWDSAHPACQGAQESMPPGVNPARTLEGWLQDEARTMGDKHFLSSQERYDECKAAVANLPQVAAVVDLTNQGDVAVLGQALNDVNAVIPLANMTNVYEHTGPDINPSLAALPFAPDAAIVYSAHAHQADSGIWVRSAEPETMIATGVEDYTQTAEAQDEAFIQLLREEE